jgi:hypothetical protein
MSSIYTTIINVRKTNEVVTIFSFMYTAGARREARMALYSHNKGFGRCITTYYLNFNFNF